MNGPSKGTQTDSEESDAVDDSLVTMCELSPGKVVLVERGNAEGWLASAHTVPNRR